ncbi:hypothetical protein HPP92_026470 [Vanilla planifolia]|uniref:Uncharacterized protein n=1 Tax=Vanilla planifolia TaxID=51239 RepID=A0A835PG88_VANPL|nr:hypothetical protein HPP92_026470 [Vanilla planifolia]
MESLKLEYKAKCQLTEGLRRTLDDLLVKFQSTGLDVEKLAKEIAAKSEEIAAAQLRYEELGRKLQEKDSALKQLSLSSESSRAGFKEKIKELEQANKELVAALDEANIKAEGEEKIICAYKREIEGLKGQMYQLQRKCSDAELRAQAPGELRRRGEMLDQLEREKGEIEDRLKWKSEQFMHLEEALSKVQDANELRTQLEMANHALAHEERRRRLLEIQISKSKEMYENIVLEYEEAKSNIETVSTKRDEEIASLRNFLSAKMMLIKDLEYKKAFLEQENQELLNAWQEARNVQCNGVDASSVKALAQKYRSLELAHKECSKNMKAREDYWKQHIHKLTAEHDECLLTLNSKNQEISLLETDLEDSNCLLTRTRMENDEMSILIALLKSKFTEICCDVQRYNLEVEQHNRKTEVRVTILREQLENRTVALIQALAELSKERKMKELNSCESVLTELAENVDRITEEAALMEIDLKENLREVSYTLDEANISLSEKMCSLEVVEFKLREQRKVISHLEHVKCDLDAELKRYYQENYETRTRMEPAVLEGKELEKLFDRREGELSQNFRGKRKENT